MNFVRASERVSYARQVVLSSEEFIASDDRVLCWKQRLLALEADEFHAGDEHFNGGNERVENVRLNLSDTHS